MSATMSHTGNPRQNPDGTPDGFPTDEDHAAPLVAMYHALEQEIAQHKVDIAGLRHKQASLIAMLHQTGLPYRTLATLLHMSKSRVEQRCKEQQPTMSAAESTVSGSDGIRPGRGPDQTGADRADRPDHRKPEQAGGPWRNPCPVCGARQPPCRPDCGFHPSDEGLTLPGQSTDQDGPLTEPPVRLCCGQRHWTVKCPDGLVMCCICFSRVPVTELHADEHGYIWDTCRDCKRDENAYEQIQANLKRDWRDQ
jgi:hypothetical protein